MTTPHPHSPILLKPAKPVGTERDKSLPQFMEVGWKPTRSSARRASTH